METISGTEAVQRMRLYSRGKGVYFGIMHFTYNRAKNTTGGLVKVERCRLRPSLPREVFEVNGDHYLPYTDLDTDKPKMAWKKLVRAVAFPPDYCYKRVDWFNT